MPEYEARDSFFEGIGRLPAVYAGGCLAAVWRLGVDMAFAAPEGEPCRFIQITEAAKERDLI